MGENIIKVVVIKRKQGKKKYKFQIEKIENEQQQNSFALYYVITCK